MLRGVCFQFPFQQFHFLCAVQLKCLCNVKLFTVIFLVCVLAVADPDARNEEGCEDLNGFFPARVKVEGSTIFQETKTYFVEPKMGATVLGP